MLRKTLMLSGWLVVVSMCWICYLLLIQVFLKPTDFELHTATVGEPVEMITDEYGTSYVGMRIELEGNEPTLSLPGKLLNLIEGDVQQLQAGTTIAYHQKKKSAYTYLDLFLSRQLHVIYSLKTDNLTYLSLEDSIAHYKSRENWMLALFILLIAVGLGWFLRGRREKPKARTFHKH